VSGIDSDPFSFRSAPVVLSLVVSDIRQVPLRSPQSGLDRVEIQMTRFLFRFRG
jgi:hypothetical protein